MIIVAFALALLGQRTAPVVTAPAPVEPAEASAGLPSGPRPYTELPATPVTAGASGLDRPSLPERGMGGDAWSARVRERFEAAQSRQGSLDGGWTLTDSNGAALYVLQLADAPGRELEGVWREAPQPGLRAGSGLFAAASRQGSQTVLSFEAPRAGGRAELVLNPSAEGWTGVLTLGGAPRDVRLVRATGAN